MNKVNRFGVMIFGLLLICGTSIISQAALADEPSEIENAKQRAQELSRVREWIVINTLADDGDVLVDIEMMDSDSKRGTRLRLFSTWHRYGRLLRSLRDGDVIHFEYTDKPQFNDSEYSSALTEWAFYLIPTVVTDSPF